MKLIRWMTTGLALAAAPAFALNVATSPSTPTPIDTVILEVAGDHPCAFIIPDSVQMPAANTIRVRYETGAAVLCVQAVPQPQHIVLGRLPAATYDVQLVTPTGEAVRTTTFTVNTIPVSGDRGPMDDYSGHWLGGMNEGVIVTQFGRTAFISYLYYAADGSPQWAIISDARWDPASNSYFGGLMRVERRPTGVSTGTGILTSFQYIGMGRFTPSGTFDHARFEASVFQETVSRDLTRFRF